jgi:hypothetical protein
MKKIPKILEFEFEKFLIAICGAFPLYCKDKLAKIDDPRPKI